VVSSSWNVPRHLISKRQSQHQVFPQHQQRFYQSPYTNQYQSKSTNVNQINYNAPQFVPQSQNAARVPASSLYDEIVQKINSDHRSRAKLNPSYNPNIPTETPLQKSISRPISNHYPHNPGIPKASKISKLGLALFKRVDENSPTDFEILIEDNAEHNDKIAVNTDYSEEKLNTNNYATIQLEKIIEDQKHANEAHKKMEQQYLEEAKELLRKQIENQFNRNIILDGEENKEQLSGTEGISIIGEMDSPLDDEKGQNKHQVEVHEEDENTGHDSMMSILEETELSELHSNKAKEGMKENQQIESSEKIEVNNIQNEQIVFKPPVEKELVHNDNSTVNTSFSDEKFKENINATFQLENIIDDHKLANIAHQERDQQHLEKAKELLRKQIENQKQLDKGLKKENEKQNGILQSNKPNSLDIEENTQTIQNKAEIIIIDELNVKVNDFEANEDDIEGGNLNYNSFITMSGETESSELELNEESNQMEVTEIIRDTEIQNEPDYNYENETENSTIMEIYYGQAELQNLFLSTNKTLEISENEQDTENNKQSFDEFKMNEHIGEATKSMKKDEIDLIQEDFIQEKAENTYDPTNKSDQSSEIVDENEDPNFKDEAIQKEKVAEDNQHKNVTKEVTDAVRIVTRYFESQNTGNAQYPELIWSAVKEIKDFFS